MSPERVNRQKKKKKKKSRDIILSQVLKTVKTHLWFLPQKMFENENRKLKFDGFSFSFSGDYTGGFSTIFENGFCSRFVFVGLFTPYL